MVKGGCGGGGVESFFCQTQRMLCYVELWLSWGCDNDVGLKINGEPCIWLSDFKNLIKILECCWKPCNIYGNQTLDAPCTQILSDIIANT